MKGALVIPLTLTEKVYVSTHRQSGLKRRLRLNLSMEEY